MNPRSLTATPAQSEGQPENAILYFLGKRNDSGSASSRSLSAVAYGATSKTSSLQIPARQQVVTLRTVLPPLPLHTSPAAANVLNAGQRSLTRTPCTCTSWRVEKCNVPLPSLCAILATQRSCSGSKAPAGSRTRST